MKKILTYVVKTLYYKLKYGKRFSIQSIQRFAPKFDLLIKNQGNLAIMSRITINDYTHFGVVAEGQMTIGANCFFNRHCVVVCRDRIDIGERCIFGPNVCIFDHDHMFDESGVHNQYKTGPIQIDDGCWIGANVTILRNTHIGEKSIIGAGCVVSGNIPAHSIVTSGSRQLFVQRIEHKD